MRLISSLFLLILFSSKASSEVIIDDARAREAYGPMSAAYMKITSDENDRLLSVECGCSKNSELHISSTDENGVMSMREMGNGIELPKGETVILQPGGLHVMFMGLSQPLFDGEHIEVTLTFEKAGQQLLSIPILSNSGDMMQGRSTHKMKSHKVKDDHRK